MSRWLILIAAAVGLFSARVARAGDPPITLSVPSAGCPSADLVKQQLLPLVGSRPIESSPPELALAVVQDEGDGYSITVGEAQREIVDASRNCLERARVSAVFIALNLPAIERAPVSDEAEPERPVAPPSEPPEPAHGARLGIQGRFETALTPEYGALSLGISAGPSLAFEPWELAFLLGFSGIATLGDLGPSKTESVELVRFPARLVLSYQWRLGAIELGPEVGAFVGAIRIRGDQVPRPETSVRLEAGVLGGLTLRWRPRERFAVGVSTDFLYSPYTYDLLVGPARKLGQTPATWLHGGISLAYTF